MADIRIEHVGGHPGISLAWRHPRALWGKLSTLVFLSVGFVAWLGPAQVSGELDLPDDLVLPAALALFVGVPTCTRMLWIAVNRTQILTSDAGLVVSHGPLPWFRGPAIRRSQILNFDVMASATDFTVLPENRRRIAVGLQVSNRAAQDAKIEETRGWSVAAMLADGSVEELATGIFDRADAQEAVDFLRSWLGAAPPDELG